MNQTHKGIKYLGIKDGVQYAEIYIDLPLSSQHPEGQKIMQTISILPIEPLKEIDFTKKIFIKDEDGNAISPFMTLEEFFQIPPVAIEGVIQ